MEIVQECLVNRKRVLIFSQFTEMLGLIRQSLLDAGIDFFYLDGHTPPRERVDMTSRFNEGEMDIFLISLKAGGTDLNLTGADTVILYDCGGIRRSNSKRPIGRIASGSETRFISSA
jgi:SNF2 family DNA or RNA helicase